VVNATPSASVVPVQRHQRVVAGVGGRDASTSGSPGDRGRRPPAEDVGVLVGAFDVVEDVGGGVVSADEDVWLPSTVDEHPATSADAATSTAIRIPARLAGAPGSSGQARRAAAFFATV
jgi:hypothetical protein